MCYYGVIQVGLINGCKGWGVQLLYIIMLQKVLCFVLQFTPVYLCIIVTVVISAITALSASQHCHHYIIVSISQCQYCQQYILISIMPLPASSLPASHHCQHHIIVNITSLSASRHCQHHVAVKITSLSASRHCPYQISHKYIVILAMM